MKLQQLRYIREVGRQNLNLSNAAEVLHTSQPGISKQIRGLEEELGVDIFVRHGKRVVAVTEPGKAILEIAQRILKDVENLKQVGEQFTEQDKGRLTIATTHTQARYALPQVIHRFTKHYPEVRLSLRQGSPTQISEMVASGEADIAINSKPELLSVPGIDVVGPLPGDMAFTVVYAAAVQSGAAQADAAKAFIKYLTSPEAQAVFKAKGYDPV